MLLTRAKTEISQAAVEVARVGQLGTKGGGSIIHLGSLGGFSQVRVMESTPPSSSLTLGIEGSEDEEDDCHPSRKSPDGWGANWLAASRPRRPIGRLSFTASRGTVKDAYPISHILINGTAVVDPASSRESRKET